MLSLAKWKWSLPGEEDLCGICHVEFEVACPLCSCPGEGCPILIGECKHAYHVHCITQWLEKDKEDSSGGPQCPMCRRSWKS